MARDADGNMMKPKVGSDDTLITEQHHAEHLDVAKIAASVLRGEAREIPEVVYGDTTRTARGLQEALDLIEDAQQRFDNYPEAVRLRAGNSLVRLQGMLETDEGCADLVDAGLPIVGFEPPVPVVEAEAGPTEPELAIGSPPAEGQEAPDGAQGPQGA